MVISHEIYEIRRRLFYKFLWNEHSCKIFSFYDPLLKNQEASMKTDKH